MYFCTVNVNSREVICTLSSTHWLQSFQPCSTFELILKKIEINAPINVIINVASWAVNQTLTLDLDALSATFRVLSLSLSLRRFANSSLSFRSACRSLSSLSISSSDELSACLSTFLCQTTSPCNVMSKNTYTVPNLCCHRSSPLRMNEYYSRLGCVTVIAGFPSFPICTISDQKSHIKTHSFIHTIKHFKVKTMYISFFF